MGTQFHGSSCCKAFCQINFAAGSESNSVYVLADVSFRSPRRSFVFIIKIRISGSKYPDFFIIFLILKHDHWSRIFIGKALHWDEALQVNPGDRVLSLLPPWHMYERAVAYHIFSCAGEQVYSSIPKFKRDLSAFSPSFFICVPLVLATLHQRVMAAISLTPGVRGAAAKFLMQASSAYVQVRVQR